MRPFSGCRPRRILPGEVASLKLEKNGAPEEIRTPNLLIRSQMLYPVELRALGERWPKLAHRGARYFLRDRELA